MKNIQFGVLLLLVLGLIANTIYEKIASKRTPSYILEEKAYQFKEKIVVEIPKELFFAGEKVPLEDAEVLSRVDREFYVNAFWHANTALVIKRAAFWLPQFEKILTDNGIPADFKYIPIIESTLTNVISPAGATGFWQFMPDAAAETGLEVSEDVDERYNPIKSAYAAVKYFKQAHTKFKNWTLVAAAYNMGMGGIEGVLAYQRVNSYYDLYLNPETSRYVMRAIAFKDIYENPEKYGYARAGNATQVPTRSVNVNKSIEDLAEWAINQKVTYKIVKEYNPWLRTKKLTVKQGKSYIIMLPKDYRPNAPLREATGDAPIRVDSATTAN